MPGAIDLTGTDATMTLALIPREELRPAIDLMVRPFLASDSLEVRAFAAAWVGVADALAEDGDLDGAIAAFDEVVGLFGRPVAERTALLQLREAVNGFDTNEKETDDG